MKSKINLWQFFGFAVVSLSGTLLHFLYDLTNESVFAAPFSGVNESTWEHMKLLYWPLLLYTLIQKPFFRDQRSFMCIKLLGALTGLASIPVFFYTINGAFGKTPDWLNITIFFVSCAVAFFLEAVLLKKDIPYRSSRLCTPIYALIGILFVIFTFLTPALPLFKDPLTGTYGI